MKRKICEFITVILILPVLPAAAMYGLNDFSGDGGEQQIVAAALKKDAAVDEFFKDEENVDAVGDESNSMFEARFFIESENYTAADSDAEKRNLKNEIRSRLELRAGTNSFFLYTSADVYAVNSFGREGDNYLYSDRTRTSRNLTVSGTSGELKIPELYVNLTAGNLRFRGGNQIFSWGTADAYNPTSYFNPSDLREYFLKSDDENKSGVPSVSAALFAGKFSIEGVIVPVHISLRLPEEGNYWDLQSPDPSVNIILEEEDEKDIRLSNAAAGARAACSAGRADFSLSCYHGPDNTPLLVPQSAVMGTPVDLTIRNCSYNVNKIGADMSGTLGDFVFQFEGVYSPDKRGIVKQDLSDIYTVQFPFETETSHYVHYAVGFNYFIPLNRIFSGHQGDTVLTVEWQQPHYFNRDIQRPLLTKIVSCKLVGSCFDNRVKLSVKFIAETESQACVTWPKIAYDFQNGLKIELSYINFSAPSPEGLSFDDNSIISYMKDRDLVTWSMRYELQ